MAELCTPLVVYIVLALISLAWLWYQYGSITDRNVVVAVIVYAVISAFMYWLCNTGKVGWAWFVLFLPVIIAVFMYFFVPSYKVVRVQS